MWLSSPPRVSRFATLSALGSVSQAITPRQTFRGMFMTFLSETLILTLVLLLYLLLFIND